MEINFRVLFFSLSFGCFGGHVPGFELLSFGVFFQVGRVFSVLVDIGTELISNWEKEL